MRNGPRGTRKESFLLTHRIGQAKRLARLVAVVLFGLATCYGMPRHLPAQTGAPKASTPASKPAGSGAKSGSAPATKSSAPPQASNDSAARNEILQSSSWRDTLRQFNDWLAVQVLYDEEGTKHIKARLEGAIGRMTPGQLKTFEADLRNKLAVLTSDRALDAQAFLAEKFLVASDAYARRIRQQLPDVLSMTAAQIDQRLSVYASRRQAKAQLQDSFQQSREQRLAANSAQLKARQQKRQQIATRTTAAARNASTPNNFTPARDYFPDVGNRSQLIIGAGFY